MNHNFQARVPKQRNTSGIRQNSSSSRYSTATEEVYSQHGFTDDTFEEDIDELGLALGKDVGKILDSTNPNQVDLDALMNIDPLRHNTTSTDINTMPGNTSTSLYADGSGSDNITSSSYHQNSAKSLVDSLLSDPTLYFGPSGSNIIPTIQNIVATVSVGCNLDLRSLSMQLRNAEYNPKRFSAIIMRIREPRATALVFQSGKLVVTGTKQEADSRFAARKFCKLIRLGGYPQVRFLDFTIQNIVSSADVRFPIKLEKLCNENFDSASYEPELFPGLIYRMLKPKVALLVFVSGKVIITGAKTRTEMITAFEDLYPLLVQCQRKQK